MLLRSLIGWLLAICLALFWPTQDPAASESPVRVVASFSILADLARQIGSSDVDVTSLIGPDSDAHVYEPKPEQASLLSQAQLFLVNGLGFEGWLPRLIDELAREAGTTPGPPLFSDALSRPNGAAPTYTAGRIQHGGAERRHAKELTLVHFELLPLLQVGSIMARSGQRGMSLWTSALL